MQVDVKILCYNGRINQCVMCQWSDKGHERERGREEEQNEKRRKDRICMTYLQIMFDRFTRERKRE